MNINVKPDEIFLATTAREEFWDVNKPIVFLGEWCQLYERRSYWEKLNSSLLRSPFDDADATEKSYRHINGIYEKILPLLGAVLNAIHGENHSTRYWRILLGPWLQSYLLVVYDRFLHIKYAADQYPNFTTIGLSEKSFIAPTDTLDYFCNLLEDSYNLQLYTKILGALGRKFPCKEIEVSRNPLYVKLLGNSWKRKVLSNVMSTFVGIAAKFLKITILRNSYFPKIIELQLVVRNMGRILPSWHKTSPCQRFEYDSEKRNVLRTVEIGESQFEQCLSTMIFADIPQCFVEGFDAVENEAYRKFPKQSRAIFSANAWYNDEAFKQWAARSADDGSALWGIQHGGIYGALKVMPSEEHEISIVDRYYTWGWNRTDCMAKVIPMPATKLIGIKKSGAENSKAGVLWVATSVPRYADFFQLFNPAHFREYLSWQRRFASALPQEVIALTRFRPHRETYEWGILERIKDCVPDILIDSWNVSFQESLDNCRLYVCDHLSTTFIEALAANKPTVLYWTPETNRLRPEAQPYFDSLKDVGILFHAPEAAASAVAAVYDDVATWWSEPQRQEAIRKFCERFARTSPDAIKTWSNELTRVSDLPSPK